MSVGKTMRLNKVLRELNISLDRAVEYLADKGHEIEARPTTKISGDVYQVLLDGFETDANKKAASKEVGEEKRKEKEAIRIELEAKLEKKRAEELKKEEVLKAKADKLELKTVGKIDIDNVGKKPVSKVEEVKEEPKKVIDSSKTEESKSEETKIEKSTEEKLVVEAPVAEVPVIKKPKLTKAEGDKVVSEIEKEVFKVGDKPKSKKEALKAEEKDEEFKPENAESIKTQYKKLDGPNFTGKKIDLKQFDKPKKKKTEVKKDANADKKKRKRIVTKAGTSGSAATRTVRPAQNRGGSWKTSV